MTTGNKRERRRHVVCAADELAPGTSRLAELGRRRILVVRDEDGRLNALSDVCPHQGGPLSGGSVERMWVADRPGEHHRSEDRTVAVCPWHNFETDVSTGCSAWEPRPLRAATYRAEIEDGDVVLYV
ncbi:Rieske (2Fe-2S) protein [Kitasatospora sp. NPDC094011]|uniref:Rieske (2Fe-2S) protein n=1 Tax=Kitasatospora sp. NPDC094011 TaxID=3364090 RepID=UPI0037FC4912